MMESSEDKVYLVKQVLAALRAGGIPAEVHAMYGSRVEVVIGLPGVRAEWFTSTPTLPLKGEGEEVRNVDGLSDSTE